MAVDGRWCQVGAMGGERVTGRDHEARAGTRRASGARSRPLSGRHPLLRGCPNMSSLPRSLAAAFLDDQRNGRPSSAPPDPERAIPFRAVSDDPRTGTITPPHRPCSESPSRADMGIPASGAPIDLMPQLQRSEPSVVKTRSGSVLSRGFILKTDYWPSGTHAIRVCPRITPHATLYYRACTGSWANCSRRTQLQSTAKHQPQCLRRRATADTRFARDPLCPALSPQHQQPHTCHMVLHKGRAGRYVLATGISQTKTSVCKPPRCDPRLCIIHGWGVQYATITVLCNHELASAL